MASSVPQENNESFFELILSRLSGWGPSLAMRSTSAALQQEMVEQTRAKLLQVCMYLLVDGNVKAVL